MTREDIENYLKDTAYWKEATEEAKTAFINCMRKRLYGFEALLTAFDFFRLGWAAQNTLTIKQAAIRYSNGTIVTMPKPKRHHNIMYMMGQPLLPHLEEEGFLDSKGNFHKRKEAREIAIKAGQVVTTRSPQYLYTEDLW